MTQQEVADFACELIRSYGLDYSFGYNRRKRCFGLCYYNTPVRRGRIELSVYILNHDEAEILETLLHEIAHAITWREYGHTGHGPAWKAVCRRIGCKPKRCAEKQLTDKYKYTAVCPTCSHKYARHRKSNERTYYCNRPGCGRSSRLIFRETQNTTIGAA